MGVVNLLGAQPGSVNFLKIMVSNITWETFNIPWQLLTISIAFLL